jgi:hypothetical protein
MPGPTKSIRLPTFDTFLADTSIKRRIAGISVVAGRGKLLTRIDQALRRYDEECRNAAGWARLDYKKHRLQELLKACRAWLDDPKKAKKTTQNHASRRAGVQRLAETAWEEYKVQIYEGRKATPARRLETSGMAGGYAKERNLLDANKRTAISLTTAKATLKDPREAMELAPEELDPAFRKDFDQLTEQDLRSLVEKYGARLIDNQEAPYVAYLSKGQRIHYTMVVVDSGRFLADFTTPFSTIEVASQTTPLLDAKTGEFVRNPVTKAIVNRQNAKWEIAANRWVYALDGYGNLFVISPDVFKGLGQDAPSATQKNASKQMKEHFGNGTRVNHSTFLAGKEVACAGEIVIEDGKLLYVSNASGHYAPPPSALGMLLKYFEDEGVELSEVMCGIATKDDITHRKASELM